MMRHANVEDAPKEKGLKRKRLHKDLGTASLDTANGPSISTPSLQ